MNKKIFIAGGAGFIGSHLVSHLLSQPKTPSITVYDNFTSGKKDFLKKHLSDARLTIINNDIKNLLGLIKAMQHHDMVIHLASNPDIAKAVTEPTVDFEEGTLLTQNIVEAMRITNTKKILYASGSGVYGDTGELEISEDYSPMTPISTYGASKLAGESLICAYAHMFDLQGIAFRFGNVVGPNQTHGVGYDFINKLRENPNQLAILGDGSQSKSYVYITDIISAVLTASEKSHHPFEVFNVATGDYITVKEIADMVIKTMNLHNVKMQFAGGDRGWKGDVPIVRLNTDKIRSLGWRNQLSSKDAIQRSIQEMGKVG